MGGRSHNQGNTKQTDLPMITGNSLYMFDDCFDSKEPLPDLDDSLIKSKNDKGCGLEEEEDGHVTPPELQEEKSQTHSISPW